jgi:hypothetical protein
MPRSPDGRTGITLPKRPRTIVANLTLPPIWMLVTHILPKELLHIPAQAGEQFPEHAGPAFRSMPARERVTLVNRHYRGLSSRREGDLQWSREVTRARAQDS